jgi:hypothetical protein
MHLMSMTFIARENKDDDIRIKAIEERKNVNKNPYIYIQNQPFSQPHHPARLPL